MKRFILGFVLGSLITSNAYLTLGITAMYKKTECYTKDKTTSYKNYRKYVVNDGYYKCSNSIPYDNTPSSDVK